MELSVWGLPCASAAPKRSWRFSAALIGSDLCDQTASDEGLSDRIGTLAKAMAIFS
ncbi:MAG: hypothetical protein AAGG72_00445 [Pseudomonadota bacterium]